MNETTIAPLTKVGLKLAATPRNGEAKPSPAASIEFIYGIAAEGMTAFEKDLFGKAPGDHINLHCEPLQMPAYFEHLLCPLQETVKCEPPFDLDIEVTSIAPVTDRELVQALAQRSEGCQCDCGCGC